MSENTTPKLNKGYIISVSAMTILLPLLSVVVELLRSGGQTLTFELVGKWFIFYAVGLRLLLAGIRQAANPAFTAKEIFHLTNADSYPIVRELGFANICFGMIGLLALFLPQWRIVSACGSGLYYGFAAMQHFFKKPVGANEMFALVSDTVIFCVLVVYVIAFF